MSHKSQAIRHSVVYSISNLLGRLVGFIMLPFYARIFETQGYGIIALVDSSIGLLSIAFSTGVHQAILKTYHEESEDRKRLVVGTAIYTVWMLCLICIPLPALTSPWISRFILDDAQYWPILLIALATFVVDMGGRSASTFLIIRQQSLLYSLVNLGQLILAIALNIYLVLYLRVGVVGIFISSFLSVLAATIVFHIKAIKDHGLQYDAAVRRKIVAFWFPLIPGEIAAYVGRQSERYIVKFLVGLNSVGILEMAYKFPPLLNILITFPFLRAWQTKCMEIGGDPDGPREIATMFTYYLFLVCWGGIFLAANISLVLKIMTPQEFWPAARIAQIDIVTTAIFAANAYLLFGLLYTKKTKLIASARTILAVGKVALSFAFVRFYGLNGAVLSAFIIEIILLAWTFRVSQRAYHLPLEYSKIITIVISAVLLVYLIEFNHIVPDRLVELANAVISNSADMVPFPAMAGRAIAMVKSHSRHLSLLAVQTLLCSLYFLVIIIVKPALLKEGGKYEVLLITRLKQCLRLGN